MPSRPLTRKLPLPLDVLRQRQIINTKCNISLAIIFCGIIGFTAYSFATIFSPNNPGKEISSTASHAGRDAGDSCQKWRTRQHTAKYDDIL